MKATVLIDNLTKDALKKEWGLAIYIEYGERRILLDTGASGAFAENAAALGFSLAKVDAGVLSHAHFDHSDGLADFFAQNETGAFLSSQRRRGELLREKVDFSSIYRYQEGGSGPLSGQNPVC